ncbi:MAG: type II toxin-antitoxin system RelE/ParE family toxin [Desulfobacteraceae bacterium]|nr:type II toxin-antitoxin system RelE/ParE family toxin [Desulfobacteraceae bacterium]
MLDCAPSLNDLRALPSNRFEALKGNRKGEYSISINMQ